MPNVIHIGCDCSLSYSGAKPARGGAYLNSGTCTYSLREGDGNSPTDGDEVASGSLSYVAASNGNYLGTIESTATELLTPGEPYTLWIRFTDGNYDDLRRILLYARFRGGE